MSDPESERLPSKPSSDRDVLKPHFSRFRVRKPGVTTVSLQALTASFLPLIALLTLIAGSWTWFFSLIGAYIGSVLLGSLLVTRNLTLKRQGPAAPTIASWGQIHTKASVDEVWDYIDAVGRQTYFKPSDISEVEAWDDSKLATFVESIWLGATNVSAEGYRRVTETTATEKLYLRNGQSLGKVTIDVRPSVDQPGTTLVSAAFLPDLWMLIIGETRNGEEHKTGVRYINMLLDGVPGVADVPRDSYRVDSGEVDAGSGTLSLIPASSPGDDPKQLTTGASETEPTDSWRSDDESPEDSDGVATWPTLQ